MKLAPGAPPSSSRSGARAARSAPTRSRRGGACASSRSSSKLISRTMVASSPTPAVLRTRRLTAPCLLLAIAVPFLPYSVFVLRAAQGSSLYYLRTPAGLVAHHTGG